MALCPILNGTYFKVSKYFRYALVLCTFQTAFCRMRTEIKANFNRLCYMYV